MISRRSLLVGSAAAFALSRLAGTAKADPPAKPNSAVVLIYFMGGFNAIFPTAKSFMGTNQFGVTASNVTDVGNGMIVDSSLFGQVSAARWQKMSQVGVAHGISNHDSAQNALWTTSKKKSRPLMLADALGGEAAIRCAALGKKPPGFHGQVGDASMQVISSLGTVLSAYGKSVDPTAPGRAAAAKGLSAAGAMSQGRIGGNPNSGADLKAGYPAGADLLTKATPGLATFDMNSIAPAYGLPAAVDQVERHPLAAPRRGAHDPNRYARHHRRRGIEPHVGLARRCRCVARPFADGEPLRRELAEDVPRSHGGSRHQWRSRRDDGALRRLLAQPPRLGPRPRVSPPRRSATRSSPAPRATCSAMCTSRRIRPGSTDSGATSPRSRVSTVSRTGERTPILPSRLEQKDSHASCVPLRSPRCL